MYIFCESVRQSARCMMISEKCKQLKTQDALASPKRIIPTCVHFNNICIYPVLESIIFYRLVSEDCNDSNPK